MVSVVMHGAHDVNDNRYHYIGNIDRLFNIRGSSMCGENPYNTLDDFVKACDDVDEFLVEHFCNNVLLPKNIQLTSDDSAWYDPNNDVWILVNNDQHHLFV